MIRTSNPSMALDRKQRVPNRPKVPYTLRPREPIISSINSQLLTTSIERPAQVRLIKVVRYMLYSMRWYTDDVVHICFPVFLFVVCG